MFKPLTSLESSVNSRKSDFAIIFPGLVPFSALESGCVSRLISRLGASAGSSNSSGSSLVYVDAIVVMRLVFLAVLRTVSS